MRRRILQPYLLSLLVIVVCVGLVMINLELGRVFPFQDQFASNWIAARDWIDDGTSPYSEVVSSEIKAWLQENGFDTLNPKTLIFSAPAFHLLPYLMFGFLDYSLSRAIWMLIIEIALFVSILICLKISDWKVHPVERGILVLVGLSWYPSVKAILFADPIPIFILCVLLAFWLATKEHGTAAGLLLAFTTMVVEVSILFAIFLIIWRLTRRDNSMLIAYLSGIAFQLVIAWILFPGWFQEWFSIMIQLYPGTSIFSTPLMRFAYLFPGAFGPLITILHLSVLLVLLLEWFGAFGKKGLITVWKGAMTLTLLYLINVQSQPSYLFLLFPGLFLFTRFLSERWKLFGKILSWFLILLLTASIWISFFQKGAWNQVEPSFVLLLMPLVVFLGMHWIRWWALQKPNPIYE